MFKKPPKHSNQAFSKFIGSFKKHQKTVHFCEFSPNGQYLFTGSVDGTAKIWKIDRNKPIFLSDDKLVAKLEEKLPQSKVD